MSEATAKATRRDICRALGPAGVDAVNSVAQTVYAGILPQLAALTTTQTQFSRELDGHDRQLCGAYERLDRLEAEAKAQRELSFWGRMQWALTGH